MALIIEHVSGKHSFTESYEMGHFFEYAGMPHKLFIIFGRGSGHSFVRLGLRYSVIWVTMLGPVIM
jgi:hypothetical protein